MARGYTLIIETQSTSGYWSDNDNQRALLFLFCDDAQKSEFEAILSSAHDDKKQLIITLLTILVLRNTFKDKKEEWKMIEKKAVKWSKL